MTIEELQARIAALEAGLRAIDEECECGEWEHPWYMGDDEILRADCLGRTRIREMVKDTLAGAYAEPDDATALRVLAEMAAMMNADEAPAPTPERKGAPTMLTIDPAALRAVTAPAAKLFAELPPDPESGETEWTEEQFDTLFEPFVRAVTPAVVMGLLDALAAAQARVAALEGAANRLALAVRAERAAEVAVDDAEGDPDLGIPRAHNYYPALDVWRTVLQELNDACVAVEQMAAPALRPDEEAAR